MPATTLCLLWLHWDGTACVIGDGRGRIFRKRRIAAEADMRGQPLAKEILAKYAARFDEMADARHVAGDVAGFERWARLACATAKDLAPYQSPTYRAVVIAPPPDKTLEDDVTVINLKIFDHTGMATRQPQEDAWPDQKPPFSVDPADARRSPQSNCSLRSRKQRKAL
jgi:hypothetical protein